MEENRQVRLVSYPRGLPEESDFRIVQVPLQRPREGEFLVRSIYLSLDPWQRLRMRDPSEFHGQYGSPLRLEEVVPGAVVGEVVETRHQGFRAGEIVEAKLGWQLYAVTDGAGDRTDDAAGIVKVDPGRACVSTALGVLGRTGMTAYFSLLDVGRITAGETILVSTAAGATGSIAGQIARIRGCRAVGLVGSEEKARFVVRDLGFDAAVDYRNRDEFDRALSRCCPRGVDVYLDMVGGDLADRVFPHMNDRGRWIVIGHIADYDKPIGSHVGLRPQGYILGRRMRMEGFVVHDYAARFPQAVAQLDAWIAQGRLKYYEYVTEGLENAPRAFIDMLCGRNIGKTLVRVGSDAVA